jgi:hypothetical protein
MATRPEPDETPADDRPRGGRGQDPPAPRTSRKRPPRGRAAVIPSEDVINAPNKHTLYMLGALALAIVTMWSASRAACNAHPMQTRKPREVSTADLARDPKGAALELSQRWAAYDFDPALELAKGSLADQIKKDQQQCETDKAACDQKRQALEEKVLATAVLLSREADRATARITMHGGAVGKESFVLEIERDGALWKGVSKRPDVTPPEPAPAPVPAPEEPSPPPAPKP